MPKNKTLEQRINDGNESVVGSIFKYEPLRMNEEERQAPRPYDKDELLKYQKDIADLAKYSNILEQSPNNPGAVRSLAKKVFGDPTFLDATDELKRKDAAHKALSAGNEVLAWYVKNNYNKLIDSLDEERLFALATSLPVYESEGNKDHNALASLVKNIQTMARIKSEVESSKDGGVEKMQAYLLKGLKDQKLAPEGRDLAFSFIQDKAYAKTLYGLSIKNKSEKLQDVLSKDDKLDKNRIIEFIKTNLGSAGEWENEKPYHLALAQMIYEAEKE